MAPRRRLIYSYMYPSLSALLTSLLFYSVFSSQSVRKEAETSDKGLKYGRFERIRSHGLRIACFFCIYIYIYLFYDSVWDGYCLTDCYCYIQTDILSIMIDYVLLFLSFLPSFLPSFFLSLFPFFPSFLLHR